MSVRVVCGELTTGRILAEVPLTQDGASWSAVLNEAGSVTATVPLRTLPARRRTQLLACLDPTRCFLAAVTGDGLVIEAGPIWGHRWDDAAGALQVTAAGLWSMWSHRLALPVVPAGQRVQSMLLTWSGLSLGTIGKRLVQAAATHTGGALPIDLPADEPGTAARTYYGYEMTAVGEALQQLVEVDGGPDVAFDPYVTTDGLAVRWRMRTGTVTDPLLHQVGEDWQWDRGAARGPLRLLSVDVDASQVATRTWVVGDGQETELLIGRADDQAAIAAGYPLLEQVTSRTSVVSEAELTAHAVATSATARRPWQTWQVETSDTVPRLGLYRPGDWAVMHIPDGHEYLTAGRYRTRILSISGGQTGKVAVGLAPTQEAR